jgi:hypothetical protein
LLVAKIQLFSERKNFLVSKSKKNKGEGIVSRQTFPLGNLYNNTRMRTTSAESENSLEKNKTYRLVPLHREHSAFLPIKGWSSDFPPLPSAFSSKRAMA